MIILKKILRLVLEIYDTPAKIIYTMWYILAA